MRKTIQDFQGVIPAVLSVFDREENLDEGSTRTFIRYLIDSGVGGLYLTGSTGEGFLMDSDERKRQVEIVLDETAGVLPVVVHVGAMSTRAAIDLARHAEKAGAAGVSSVPPFYFKYTDEQKYGYYRDISEATSLPMIIYNIPLAGMMPVDMIRRLSELENVRGIKYTGTAIYEVSQIREACKDGFLIYGGCDELGSSNIALGVDGIIGTFYNCIHDLYRKIWDAVQGERLQEAAELQRKALHIITVGLNSGSCMACVKLWLRAAGIPAGWSRRPFSNFSSEEELALVQELLALDERDGSRLDIARRIRERL